MLPELSPCPWCYSARVSEHEASDGTWRIMCNDCGSCCHGSVTQESVRDRWDEHRELVLLDRRKQCPAGNSRYSRELAIAGMAWNILRTLLNNGWSDELCHCGTNPPDFVLDKMHFLLAKLALAMESSPAEEAK